MRFDDEVLSEAAWSSPGSKLEFDAPGPTITVLENVITSSGDWSYWRKVTFDHEGSLWQFTAEMDHRDGGHTYHAAYPVVAETVMVKQYKKVPDGHQADRPVQRPALPARYAPPGGWPGDT